MFDPFGGSMPYYPAKKYNFETGMYRPPSEGGSSSLLLRMTRNCPWNHCTFCAMYKKEKFELRKPEDIIQDINVMHEISRQVKEISLKQGQKGIFTPETFVQFMEKTPDLYFHPGISMLFDWLISGAKTVFLQDADSLIMKTAHMIQVLKHLKTTFPSIKRITSYSRSRTIVRKPAGDLARIYKAGLNRLHIGLETGDAALLKKIKKGATPEDHIRGGQKAMEAGFQVSEYWMPGLGGKTMSKDHAKNTAHVLTRINPHYIRSRPFTPRPGTVFFEKALRNELEKMTPRDQLLEIKQTLEALDVTSKVCFDHAGNYWTAPNGRLLLSQGYEGYQFPEEKENLLKLLEKGISHYK
jgi:radical SAM superfamily enzyme YgiQ (UPF0313 family)